MAENNQYWKQLIANGIRYLQEQNNDAAAAVLTAGVGGQTTGRLFYILSAVTIQLWEIGKSRSKEILCPHW